MDIRPVEPSDLDTILGWIEDEGWGAYDRSDLELLLRLSPAGCLKLVGEGGMIGAVFSMHAERTSYISFFLVKREHRNLGNAVLLGRAALARALQRSELVVIFANKKWVDAYRRSGFVSLGDVTRFQLRGGGEVPEVHERFDPEIIAALNRRAYHAPRTALVREQIHTQGARCFVYRREGYACARKVGARWLIGPLVASSDAAAVKLVRAILARLQGETVIADAPLGTFSTFLAANRIEFTLRKSVEKMYLGNAALLEAAGMVRVIGAHHYG